MPFSSCHCSGSLEAWQQGAAVGLSVLAPRLNTERRKQESSASGPTIFIYSRTALPILKAYDAVAYEDKERGSER